MNYFVKFFKHLHTVNKHRFLVMKYCFKLGLYKQGLTHDLSKYSPIEFFTSVKYFSGTRSPIDAEKEDRGYSMCWQHHKGHNPHHWEYFVDNLGPVPVKETAVYESNEGEKFHITKTTIRSNPTALEIPINYVLEMICDWIAAGKTYMKKDWDQHAPLAYYEKMRSNRLIEEKTERRLYSILKDIDKYGIDTTFNRIKSAYVNFYEDKNAPKLIGWKKFKKTQFKS